MTGRVIHRFRRANAPYSKGATLRVMLSVISAGLTYVLTRNNRYALHRLLDNMPKGDALLAAMSRLMASAKAWQDNDVRFIACTWRRYDSERGRPRFGDPSPSDLVGAMRAFRSDLRALYLLLDGIIEQALPEAAAIDNTSALLASGRARFDLNESTIRLVTDETAPASSSLPRA